MLTLKERYQAMQVLAIFCKVNLFPAKVDVHGLELHPGSQTRWYAVASTVSYGMFLANVCYKFFSLLYVLFFLRETPMHQIMIHAVVAVATVVLGLWYYGLYIKHAHVNAAFLRATLTGNDSGGGSISATALNDVQDGAYRSQPLWRRSLQDLIAIGLPYMVLLAAAMVGACYVYDPTMRLLLYTVIPKSYQSWLSYWILWMEEMRLIVFAAGVCVPVWQLQIIAFDLVNTNLQAVVGTKRSKWRRGKTFAMVPYKRLRNLQLYIQQLNIVNQDLIFTWKLLSLGVCIVSGYAAIGHTGDHPLFGVMYCVIFTDAALIYTLIYEEAFKVPGLFERAKKATLLLTSSSLNAKAQRMILCRRMRSIPAMGINVGQFHSLERNSIPVFLGYVLTHIVNMLVAYK